LEEQHLLTFHALLLFSFLFVGKTDHASREYVQAYINMHRIYRQHWREESVVGEA
jgi:Skp family chaperone for outer membrane proteins